LATVHLLICTLTLFSGKTENVDLKQYLQCKETPLIVDSQQIINYMNDIYQNKLYLFCKFYSGIFYLILIIYFIETEVQPDSVFMYTVDKFGFNLLAKSIATKEWCDFRFPFPFEMETVSQCKSALEEAIAHIIEKQIINKL
jgi:hypothetical protein